MSSINPKVLPYLQLYLDKYGTFMLTFLVIVSRQPGRSAPCSRLSASSPVTISPVVHPVSVQQLTKCSSRKSFFLKTIHFDGGCAPSLLTLSRPRPLRPYILSPIPFLFTHLRTLLRYFAFSCTHQICNSFLFKRFRTLWQKHPGWGTRVCVATTSRGHKLCAANHSLTICCGRDEQKPSTHTDSYPPSHRGAK